MPEGAFTAGRALEFSDAILNVAGEVQSYKSLIVGMTNFVPAAIIINESNDQGEEALGYAQINGWLVGENSTMAKTYMIVTKQPIGLAFAVIFSDGTTARGIKVLESK
jgi:hypothetical protein